MLRTITLFTCLLMGFVFTANAQMEFSANPEYGQIFDIVYDNEQENTLYARTVGNHIVKSEDHGQTWEILYSDPMDQYCTLSSLRLMNDGDNLSFIVKAEGTDYNKVVIINPEDGSVERTFSAPNSHQSDILIASYDVYEADNDIAILHTTFSVDFNFTSEVFFTTDGGISWESIYYAPHNGGISVNNVAIAPDDANKLFIMRGVATGRDFGGLYLSLDGGDTWTEKIAGNNYSAITFNPNNPQDILLGTFYGFDSHQENLYRSLDGGDTWNIVPITWTSMSSDHINQIAFNPTNTDNIIVLEENEIAISTDNGVTWENHVYPEINPETYHYGLSVTFNPFTANEVIIGTDFYPLKSIDGGVTLEKLENPLVNSTGRIDFFTSPTETHLYYGLRNGYIHRNMDTGEEAGVRMRSLNNSFGATTFPYADKEVAGRIFNSARFGWDSILEMSTDHGQTYMALYTTMEFLNIYELATAPTNSNIVWFSFGDKIKRIDVTDPATPVVDDITLPIMELCHGLVIDPIDESRVVIAQGSKVFVTTDGGLTWEEASEGLENLEEGRDTILKIAINPLDSDEYVLTSTKGIFLSEDAGLTWTQVFEEFVENIVFSSETDGHIVAINHYSDGFLFPQSETRIIYSTDGGETWEIIPGEALEYLNAGSSAIQFHEDNADVYFGTFDTGLVKYNIELITLGTTDMAQSQEVSLFPNPATDFINVSSESSAVKNVTIYTVTGQEMLQVSGNTQQIDISKLRAGMHLIKIETEEGTTFKRLLKQ